ncbi:unnamed protein product [Acanthoscelides obtectus]|uniref:Uncharacterized protein n=1 Tax=Acanthoscelides obtectus TaxID=200917 RepID=A0A9P0Q172_ACAOB|nr:unnamed protein product [Acanthoscelides obtectus]CAK1641150.1 hypothetical protein AOBTE_LOCUS12193 [Acanthoscelides obtectus]
MFQEVFDHLPLLVIRRRQVERMAAVGIRNIDRTADAHKCKRALVMAISSSVMERQALQIVHTLEGSSIAHQQVKAFV